MESRSLAGVVQDDCEAMPAHTMRQLLRDRIEGLLPDGALAAAKVVEEEERKAISIAALAMEGRAPPPPRCFGHMRVLL